MIPEKFFQDLIRQGEGEQVEFKTSVNEVVIGKTVCSFLNKSGGAILVGISDSKECIGIEYAEEKAISLNKYLINNIIPDTLISVSICQFQSREILLIEVPEGSKKPYIYSDGSLYYRKNSTTIKPSSVDIQKIIEQRSKSELHWERQLATYINVNDLDIEELEKTISHINERGRSKQEIRDIESFLQQYGLLQNGNLTNAAVVLFAKNPTYYLPQCRFRLTKFINSKTDSFIQNDLILENNLFKNITSINDFFQNNLEFQSTFTDTDWQREDKLQYPIQALREGVMNALIHRDYSNVSASAMISVYPDKLEISNYGMLPDGLKPSDLKRSHLSIPQNPDIAHICFLRGYIEKIGRGTIKIIDECKSARLKEPTWISKNNVVNLTFYYERSEDISFEQLNERQKKVISNTKFGDLISVSDYINIVYADIKLKFDVIGERTARNDMQILLKGGWFIKNGSGPATKYFRLKKYMA
jgi:ATP-dependent DNA helicase RecG